MRIQLSQQALDHSLSLEAALAKRETKREYSDTDLSLENLSRLLFAAQGKRNNDGKRLAPSAQEQYPLSIFIVVNRVVEVEAGLYRYDNSEHSIVLLERGCFSKKLEDTAIGEQPWVEAAAAVCILAGNVSAMNQHFSDQPPSGMRGERYTYIEVGAVAQNMQLQGAALNLSMVLVGRFDNHKVKVLLSKKTELGACPRMRVVARV